MNEDRSHFYYKKQSNTQSADLRKRKSVMEQ